MEVAVAVAYERDPAVRAREGSLGRRDKHQQAKER
jgi:hypothetical protein